MPWKKRIDLVWKIFWNTVVKSFHEIKNKHSYWNCICTCWNEFTAEGGSLNSGRDNCCKKCKVRKTKYGSDSQRLHRIYKGIRARCNNSNRRAYKDYWWRGIKCERNTFQEFYNDMFSSYEKTLTIDRIYNNGNYCKENCKWSTMGEQASNRRSNNNFTINWEILWMEMWAKRYWIDSSLVRRRMKRGMSFEEAITKPVKHFNR